MTPHNDTITPKHSTQSKKTKISHLVVGDTFLNQSQDGGAALLGIGRQCAASSHGSYRHAYWTCLFHFSGNKISHFSPACSSYSGSAHPMSTAMHQRVGSCERAAAALVRQPICNAHDRAGRPYLECLPALARIGPTDFKPLAH